MCHALMMRLPRLCVLQIWTAGASQVTKTHQRWCLTMSWSICSGSMGWGQGLWLQGRGEMHHRRGWSWHLNDSCEKMVFDIDFLRKKDFCSLNSKKNFAPFKTILKKDSYFGRGRATQQLAWQWTGPPELGKCVLRQRVQGWHLILGHPSSLTTRARREGLVGTGPLSPVTCTCCKLAAFPVPRQLNWGPSRLRGS